ncbi:VOC family protein [Robiginitalea sp. SC105]|uniref:VOC family protein n=1 Tax=Robiginitalea sp. SC105 TaxID=2762332 RepID=UPI00163A3C5E|nr:VOC family protein [Robiginitalea sp. SC105]MBC2838569.1 VOC family protein [Robiginitalea sp. SC105]
MEPFKIDFLDHVAIRVANLEASAAWYAKVLGLEKYQLPEWRDFPIFMLAGKSVYTTDPDGHTVELTTLVVEENAFYRKSDNP